MIISIYLRTYPIKDAPVSYSFFPSNDHQKHTFTVGTEVYQSESKEVRVIVPNEAKVDSLKNLLGWPGEKGLVKSTAKEVYDLAVAGTSGFKIEK